jgi:hypothetical protein
VGHSVERSADKRHFDITYYPGKDKIGIFGEHYSGVLRKSGEISLYEDEDEEN